MTSAQRIWGSLHSFYEDGAILGRTRANRDFIRAFLRRSEASGFFDAFHFFLPVPDDTARLEERLKTEFPRLHRQGRFTIRLARELPEALAGTDYYCFHLSDPFVFYADLLRLRNSRSRVIFPVTAPTHSLSYREYGHSFLYHLWPGVSKRDAVIATSRCGRDVVAAMYAMLRRQYRLDEEFFPAPGIPVIPLGVALEDFPAPEDRNRSVQSPRSRIRAELGMEEDRVLFLTLARISYQSKMDLLPVLQAFKRAESAGLTPGSYSFVLAGWESEQDNFGSDVETFCARLGIACAVVRRPDDARRKALYAAADIFLSPVDNVQETFGLTMLEAAASSLPVIASDFDGYRDLVADGETGILIPTLGPEDTADTNTGSAVLPASEYHLRLAQQCVVDVKSLGLAMARLGTDAALRRAMGEKARKHALACSWEGVVERYMELWRDLNARPLEAEEEDRLRRSTHPAEIDYGGIFSGYYSATLGAAAQQERLLRRSARGGAIYRGKDFPVIYAITARAIPWEALKRLLLAARKPLTLASARILSKKLGLEYGASGDSDFLLLWCIKHDLLEFMD